MVLITLLYYLKNKQLNIFDINKHQTASFIYKIMNNQLPPNFNMYFKQNEQVHDLDRRKKSNIHIIHHSSTMRSFTIQFHGPHQWNSFEPTIKLCPSLASYKTNTKNYYYLCISSFHISNYIICSHYRHIIKSSILYNCCLFCTLQII